MKAMVFFLLFFASTSNAVEVERDLVRAMALISQGEKTKAYKVLESVFNASKDIKTKSEAALLLSFAGNKDLKGKKRSDYAWYLFSSGDASVISSEAQKVTLLRIAGDGFFDDGNLEMARKGYEQLLLSAENEDRDYASYKLGWIDLNEEHPELAFNRWYTSIRGKHFSKSSLRDSFFRDLGRVWSESKPPVEAHVKKVESLELSEEDMARFVEGVAFGVRRLTTYQQVDNFRAQVLKTKYAQPVFSKLVSQNIGLSKDACSILDWLEAKSKISTASVEASTLLQSLNACYTALGKGKTVYGYTDKNKQKIMRIVMSIEASGLARLPRAALLEKIEANDAACSELTKAINEASHEIVDPKSMLLKSIEICGKSKKGIDGEAIFTLLTTMAQKSILDAEVYGSLFNLLKSKAQLAEAFSQRLLNDASVYASTRLPEIAAATDQSFERQKELYARYVKEPLGKEQEVWRQISARMAKELSDKKLFGAAFTHLKSSFGLSADLLIKDSLVKESWLYWLAQKENSERDSMKDVIEALIRAAGRKLSQEEAQLIAVISLKNHDLKTLWKNWSLFQPYLEKNKKYFSVLFDETFMFASERPGEMLKSAKSQMLSAIEKIASIKKPEQLDLIGKEAEKLKTAGIKAIDDLEFARKIKSELHSTAAKTKLKMDTKLVGNLEKRFAVLKTEMKKYEKRVWSRPELADVARQTLAQSCDGFISDLEKLKYPKSLPKELIEVFDAQVKNAVNVLEGWKTKLGKSKMVRQS